MIGLGADEGDVVLGQNVGESRILGEKAIAGMHGVGAGDLTGRQQRGHVEIAVARGGRADAHALVGELDVHRVLVGGRIDRDRGDAELLGGAQHAQGDFAAIGDQDLVEHGRASLVAAPSRAAAGNPGAEGRTPWLVSPDLTR